MKNAISAIRFGWYRDWKVLVMVLGDLTCCTTAFVLALLLRFEFAIFGVDTRVHLAYLPVVIVPQILSFLFSHVYASMWRYTSIRAVLRLCAAVAFAFMVSLAFLMYFWDSVFSRGVLVIDALLAVLFTSGLRVGVRLYFERKGCKAESVRRHFQPGRQKRRVLILGAGSAGELILREIQKTAGDVAVAILDDDPRKTGRTLHGVQIVGPISALHETVNRFFPDEILICIPSAKGEAMRRIVELCEASDVKYKTLPSVNEIIHDDFDLTALREVRYEDLLGREPVTLVFDPIKEYLTDKIVLVTGCGGSIGSELCRKILAFKPRCILLLDSGEFNLFNISSELKTFHNFSSGVPLLANLTDIVLLRDIFEKYRPEVVFHAAAYKHVPLLEVNPWEAVYNNIQASQNLIEVSLEYKVGTFVLVSTDKAVRPTNVMGASKRITELLLRAHMDSSMRCMAVRFGNVIGSSGSVIPFFLKQIQAGKPITVTHPEITRYFMTIGEAAQLILQAGGIGVGGDTFLIKMGQSVRISDIANDLIRLCGKVPEQDVPILFTGLRPGEKLYEELITAGENVMPTPHNQLMKLRTDIGGTSPEERRAFREELLGKIVALQRVADQHDASGIKRLIQEIVPEYMPQDNTGCVL